MHAGGDAIRRFRLGSLFRWSLDTPNLDLNVLCQTAKDFVIEAAKVA